MSYDDFVADLPPSTCRYAIYDFEYEREGEGKRNKICFYAWLVLSLARCFLSQAWLVGLARGCEKVGEGDERHLGEGGSDEGVEEGSDIHSSPRVRLVQPHIRPSHSHLGSSSHSPLTLPPHSSGHQTKQKSKQRCCTLLPKMRFEDLS